MIKWIAYFPPACGSLLPDDVVFEMKRSSFLTTMLLFSALMAGITVGAKAAFAESKEEYFEKNVRPLLAKRCFECHGEKKQESDVRMDLRANVITGGLNGPLVQPGKVAESRLWQVLQHSASDVQMPPDNKMPEEELAIIKHWIEQGAFWPESPAKENAGQPRNADGTYNFVEAVKRHWAYQPVTQQKIPEPKQIADCRTPIDRFIAAKQEEKNLTFSPVATRETLIRRIAMDLVGIPPTFEEVQNFVNDERPDAIERLVDHYLASPAYGERWGRFWLDIARYADTKGYVFTENRYYPYSYTYRDYVVQAFNEDKPYNQFVLEQLAADRLGLPENDPRLRALGFLTVGNRFLNRGPDIIDDRIDVVTRGFMGMTVACARCHDHKYDPIPTADYYSLYGVFDSSYEPELGPIIGKVDESNPEYIKFKEELDKREKAITDYVADAHQKLRVQLTDRTADHLLGAAKLFELIPKDNVPYADKEPRIKLVERWKNFIASRTDDKVTDPVWTAWKTLMAVPDQELANQSEAKLQPILDDPAIPTALKDALKASPVKSHLDVAKAYGVCLSKIVEEWKQAQAQMPPVNTLADAGNELLRKTLFGEGSASDVEVANNTSPFFERDNNDHIRGLRAKVNDWYAQSPGAPGRAMVMFDKEKPVKPVVFLRGDPNRRGPAVERHSPRILEPEQERPFKEGSGRLELAKAIIDNANPLTARVIVNRIWARHFGAGFVDTTSDFGTRGSEPTHPELLDYLAWTFVHEDNWSIKALHRRIMLSRTYLQSSNDRPEARQIDAVNTFLWRQNRQRLEFEMIRDAMLAISGQLDLEVGGRPMQLESKEIERRRTIYALIDRNNLPGLFRTFDYPSPDASSPGRPVTTVPQQALFMMNSEFMHSTATKLAENVRSKSSEPAGQAKIILESVFSRPASAEEIAEVSKYLEAHPLDHVAQALLMTNEFMFVD